MQHKLTT